ncbi:hypothetical protein [Virgisporangium aurantiacum]|uniref:Uncharacterized protein n=1 Tax=Virgisporangium aurantiacum TaxID=175570 RepID=A0A8J4E3C2_9ACTN|nr:hypothetical protein [Virgisporangium aurantiacum]GIJ60685.1 hypothetical protein Vau01_082010 [Virgisporangium aurantiacum]
MSVIDPLARRYRRLLVAYPRAYRRERGAELLGALLDAAPPGRTRPTPREAVDLIRAGLRARLGRPASRTVVTWALLVATISGTFGAAFATRAAWETAPPLPDGAEARAMAAEILPGQEFSGFEAPAAQFTMYGSPLSWDRVGELLWPDGGEYALSGIGGSIVGDPGLPVAELAGLARRNLRAHGWTVYPTTTTSLDGCDGPDCPPAPYSVVVAARRGHTTFRLEMYSPDALVSPSTSVAFQQATPAAVYPFGIGAGLLGAVVAFLVFGWASRRTQRRATADATAKVMLGVTLFLWWVPTAFALPAVAHHHAGEAHPSWHPMWEWLGQPSFSGVFVVGCGFALAGLAVAVLAGRERVPVAAMR